MKINSKFEYKKAIKFRSILKNSKVLLTQKNKLNQPCTQCLATNIKK